PVTRHRPSALKAIGLALPPLPVNVRSSRPVVTSQSRVGPSGPALARRSPSGLNATELTRFGCPRSVRTRAPVAASQRITSPGVILPRPCTSKNGLPPPADAINRPSGLYATPLAHPAPLCPPEREQVGVVAPLEEMPLPAAPALRTAVEEVFRPRRCCWRHTPAGPFRWRRDRARPGYVPVPVSPSFPPPAPSRVPPRPSAAGPPCPRAGPP